jgi:hypothetical protein
MPLSSVTPRKARLPVQLSAYQSKIQVKTGDRFLLAGTSGSGKTTAAKMLDKQLGIGLPTSRHYIFDSKFDGDFDDYPGRVESNMCPSRPVGNQRYQVWQPYNLIPEEIEKWLAQILRDAPAIVLIDELVHLRYKGGHYSPMYEQMQKVGRSKKIITLTCTQELSKIPANAYKQATHRLLFYIDKAAMYDRQIMHLLLKEKVPDHPDEFGMYYQSEKGRGEPLYFSSIQKFLG